MATSKVKMKVQDPLALINKVIDQFELKVPEYIIKLEYFEDLDGSSLTAFFSNERAVNNDPISTKVTMGLSKTGDPVFLEIFLK